jgi:hypothetical protein
LLLHGTTPPLKQAKADVKRVAGSDSDPLVFCAKKVTDTEYEFIMNVRPGQSWGAVGFNTGGAVMTGTEIMWLGVEDGEATLKYKLAAGQFTPADSVEQPNDVEVANTANGIQARWKRPVKQTGLIDLTDGTSALTIIYAAKAGAVGGFAQHDVKLSTTTDLAEPGASVSAKSFSATKGNLAHGALMILAWACMTPIGTFFMKYGKHLPPSIWFKTHKFIQPLGVLVCIIAFIIILASGVTFSELQGKSKAHAQMGIAVVALCLVQVILGYSRTVRVFDRNLHSRMPLIRTPARLKRARV